MHVPRGLSDRELFVRYCLPMSNNDMWDQVGIYAPVKKTTAKFQSVCLSRLYLVYVRCTVGYLFIFAMPKNRHIIAIFSFPM